MRLLSTRQVLNFVHRIDQPLVGADIVEYNPRCDFGACTATLAAKLTKEIAAAMWRTGAAGSPRGRHAESAHSDWRRGRR